MLTIPLAHAGSTCNLPYKFSSAFCYVLGDRSHCLWGKVLDIFALFATLGGLATTTALIALQISSGLNYQCRWELPGLGAYLIIGVLAATGSLKGIHTPSIATASP
jgi:glycine betaine transporter